MTEHYGFTNHAGHTLSISADSPIEAAVLAEKIITQPFAWDFDWADMKLGHFLESARSMFAPREV